MKLIENNVIYSKDLSKIKESISYFFKHTNSKYEITEKTKLVEFNEFFKDILFFKNDLYSNFKIKDNILFLEITFSSPLNPFPYIEEIGNLNNVVVIHDLETNWIGLLNKSNLK
jgi:hypothetical protein